ncbi:hypothetical protein AAFM46_03405 [Arthrobacter sp. TMP15]|uniref:hypothetical protein n=1 Tax=Arthrobacter sp. TMP15 TaxID=3140789 RepID=UPI0031BB06E1
MEVSEHPRIRIPYPVSVSDPIMVDTADVVISLRGLAATNDEVSFVMNAAIRVDKDFMAQGATLSAGRPFNMPHETPDPDSLTVRCRWQLVGDTEYQDDTEFLEKWGPGPLSSGGWSYMPTAGIWEGFFLLIYPVPVANLQTFSIEISWNNRGIENVCRDVIAPQLVEALAYASSPEG